MGAPSAISHNKIRTSIWKQPLLSVVQNHLVAYPTPSNLNISWNWGVLSGLCLVLQIVTGVCLAMHYTPQVDLAFSSVQHIMRDVPSGWLLRYLHANGASFFFIVVYIHLFRGIYYSSYAPPRELVWLVGVAILLLMIITAFIGYVLPWGKFYFAQNEISFEISYIVIFKTHSQIQQLYDKNLKHLFFRNFVIPRVPAQNRIGPHSLSILSLIYGSLLGDSYGEYHGNGARFQFHYSFRSIELLTSLQKKLALCGYCSDKKLKISKQIGRKNQIYFSIKLHTYTFTSFKLIVDDWYSINEDGKCMKRIPKNLALFLTPNAIAQWIMDDGHFTGSGLLISTNSFTSEEHEFLQTLLFQKYKLNTSIQSYKNQYRLYFPSKEILKMRQIVQPYLHSSMLYKLGL